MKPYQIDPTRDIMVDIDPYGGGKRYILVLPPGYKFKDKCLTVLGFDTMDELLKAAAQDVVQDLR